MVSIPDPISDIFELSNNLIRGNPSNPNLQGFGAPIPPSQGGAGVRQSRVLNGRDAVNTRNIVKWFVPEIGIIEMYINPQSIKYNFKKHISNQRTKGGYILQYWGEELSSLSIQGTTGSSGVEGINVLEDIYRAEQLAYDPFALTLASERDADNDDFSFLGDNALDTVGNLTGFDEGFTDLIANSLESGNVNSTRAKPTLASLAFSVEMYWSGWVFRGYFMDFSIDERANNVGLFDYSMTFIVTQKRGFRQNFLGHHRSPTNGPSNSDPEFGTPYSYGELVSEYIAPTQRNSKSKTVSLEDSLKTGASLISSGIRSFTSIF